MQASNDPVAITAGLVVSESPIAQWLSESIQPAPGRSRVRLPLRGLRIFS